VSGIEVAMSGEKVGWSIADYLASLERSVGELLKEKSKVEAESAPKTEPKPELTPSTKVEPKREEPKREEPKREEPKHEANEHHA
jgi:F-type H+-transporting ATPase subunit b